MADRGDPERDVAALMREVPTAETIRSIGDTPDNELRAHRIALAYHQISRALNARLRANEPDGVYNANWFNFALWGTLTVTGNINNTRAPQRLNTLLATPLRRRLSPGVVRAKAADGQLVGRALAWGQRMIFMSTALSISAYLFERLEADGHQLDEPGTGRSSADRASDYRTTMRAVVESTGPDPSSDAPPSEDRLHRTRHQAAIERAMRMYEVAEHATGRDKAQLVFGANVLLTEVEQDIVDPALTKIVDLVPRKVGSAIDWRLARGVNMVRGVPSHVAYVGLQRRREDWRRFADFTWARFMTDQVFVMALPTETVRLGRDIPAWRRDQPFFPDDLRDLTPDPSRPADERTAWLHDVAHRVKSLDRTSGDGRGSAARDWRRWDERMNWAITLLRSRQHDTTLTWSPYSQEDRARILALRLPMHGGDPSALEVASALDKHVFDNVDPSRRAFP